VVNGRVGRTAGVLEEPESRGVAHRRGDDGFALATFVAPAVMSRLGADENPDRCNERRDEVGVVYLRGVRGGRGIKSCQRYQRCQRCQVQPGCSGSIQVRPLNEGAGSSSDEH
jgi:hypothetical protein